IPAALSLIADYHSSKTRSLAVGLHMTGLYVGQALGGFGATIAEHYTWQQTFFLFGWIGIAFSFVLILFLYEKRNTAFADPALQQPAVSATKGLSILFRLLPFWIILI